MLFDDSENKNLFSPYEIQNMTIEDNNDRNAFISVCT